MKNFLNRYSLILFFPLTYLLSWWIVPLLNGGLFPQGPAFAAIILTGLTLGRQGLRAYRRQITNWSAGLWYLVGPLIIVSYTVVGYAVNLSLGATMAETPHWLSVGTFIQLLLFGGQWEELGWTGYALPALQEHFSNRPNGGLIAIVVLGVLRAIWHLPLFLYGKMYWFDIFVFSFAFQIIIAWLYQYSGKSVPAVMLFHFVSNIMGSILFPVFVGTDRVMFYALFMSLAAALAIVLVIFSQIKTQPKEVVAV